MGAGRPVVRVRWAVGQGVICFPSAPGAEGWGWRREGGKESGTRAVAFPRSHVLW